MKSIFKLSAIFVVVTCLATPSVLFANTKTLASDSQLKQSRFISATDPNKKIEFNAWLKLRNEDKLDEKLREIYNPASKYYHHYLTPKQLNEAYGPTAEDIKKVKKYFTSKGFDIITDDKKHLYLQVKGTVAQIEREFHVKINNYRYKELLVYSNDKTPMISNELSTYISNISSLNSFPPFMSKCTSVTGNGGSTFNQINGLDTSIQAALVDSQGNIISPNMIFTGFIPRGARGVGYAPAQIQHAYGVDQLFSQGINGSGQTVVIVDSCLSQSLLQDLNAFTSANNLPAITVNGNLQIQTFGGPTAVSCEYGGIPQQEETIDVESFHSMAPNANIILAVNGSSSLDNLTLLSDAIMNNPVAGYLVSNSHSSPELTQGNIESSLKFAAAMGMSVNNSSGDCGDNTIFVDANFQKQVNYPASSSWITAVGGTMLFLDNYGNYLTETGWGTARNISYLCNSGGPVCTSYTPTYSNQGANAQGFVEGSTGGISQIYPAQPWQQNTIINLYAGGYGLVKNFVYSQNPFTLFRAVPDISMFAEGYYPAFEIYITLTSGGSPAPSIGAGTSLACPLFTGVLTLVNQERRAMGKAPIGLASAYLYSLPASAVHAINNPHGMGNPVAGIPNPNAFQLFQVDPLTGNLLGIVYNWDSSLTLGPYWNDVTGVGSPNAPIFVTSLAMM